MTDLLGPGAFGAARAASARPALIPGNLPGDPDTWAKDCTSPTANDGTENRAALFNMLIAQLRSVVRPSGVTDSNLDDYLLMRAIRSGGLNYIQAGGTANALTLTYSGSIGPASYAQLRYVFVVATLANTRADVTINANALGTRPILRRAGAKLRRGDIQPGPMLLIDTGSAYELVGAGASGRTLLQANLTLYVATSGSDTLNDGLDPASPFLTVQRAWSEIQNNYDLNGFQAVVQIADGTYTGGVSATGGPLGANAGTSSVTFQGNAATPANVFIATTGSSCFLAQGGAQFTVKDMKLQTAGASTNCLLANPGGLIAFTNVNFGATVTAHCQALGGFIQATGNYTISGGAAVHGFATALGKVSQNSVTVTLIGTPNFSTGYAYAQQGRVEEIGVTFSGAATGPRYVAIENGVVTVNGAGAAVLPGNAVGTTASGGQYI